MNSFSWLVILVLILIVLLIALLFYSYYDVDGYFNVIQSSLNDLDKNYSKKERAKSEKRVVISLTTTPDRIFQMKNTLKSLLLQSVRVDEIRLNIPYKSLKGVEYQIPDWMLEMKSIKIVRVEDEGPGSKLYQTVRDEKGDTLIIVVDDDMIYQRNLVSYLVKWYYKRKESEVIAAVGRQYSNSGPPIGFLRRILASGYVDTITGVDGFLIRADMLPEECFDYSEAPVGARFVDDDWISGWLRIKERKIWSPGLSWKTGIWFNPEAFGTVALSKTTNKVDNNVGRVVGWFRNKATEA